MDPGQEKVPLANRGAALWGDLVITVANYPPRSPDSQTFIRFGLWRIRIAFDLFVWCLVQEFSLN
jgi:hypothetical protein